jgi:hypothetical protein
MSKTVATSGTSCMAGHGLHPSDEEKRIDLESLIREDFERCHPNDTFDDLKKRASFSKEDKGLLRDWMAIAAHRAEAYRKRRP